MRFSQLLDIINIEVILIDVILLLIWFIQFGWGIALVLTEMHAISLRVEHIGGLQLL